MYLTGYDEQTMGSNKCNTYNMCHSSVATAAVLQTDVHVHQAYIVSTLHVHWWRDNRNVKLQSD